MLMLVVLLLAAILITLLGAWGIVPGSLFAVLGVVVWVLLIAHTAEYVGGGWALIIWIFVPVVALIVFGMFNEDFRDGFKNG